MKNKPKIRLHIGMRTMKTVAAVFICAMIDWLRGRTPFYSMLAAAVSIQRDIEHTVRTAVERVLSSLLGGAAGLIFLLVIGLTPIASFTPPYYLLVSLMLIPVIMIAVSLKKPECAYLSCAVFLSIAVMHADSDNPLSFAITRTTDTLVGVVVGLLINLIPARKKPDDPNKEPDDIKNDVLEIK